MNKECDFCSYDEGEICPREDLIYADIETVHTLTMEHKFDEADGNYNEHYIKIKKNINVNVCATVHIYGGNMLDLFVHGENDPDPAFNGKCIDVEIKYCPMCGRKLSPLIFDDEEGDANG